MSYWLLFQRNSPHDLIWKVTIKDAFSYENEKSSFVKAVTKLLITNEELITKY